MMKIGILTIHDSPNYGACLQCYGLWRFLVNEGYDCEVIDLHRPGAHLDYIPSQKFKASRIRKKSWLQKIKSYLRGKSNKDISIYSNRLLKERFSEFNSKIKQSRPYVSIDLLYQNPPEYDVYIAGSDQLWNPSQRYCIEPYFLTFVKDRSKKKISFSTSIGITELTVSEKQKFKTWLSDFDFISVREKQAKLLLESFVDRNIEQVADPTFLLPPDEWHKIATFPKDGEKYLLYFALHMDAEILQYCISLSKESGLKLIVLNQRLSSREDAPYEVVNDAGPREFLGYMANAELVVTDSFHGTVFSMIMGAENFYTYILKGNQRGSRIEDLLETFALSDHIFRTPFAKTFSQMNSSKPNREQVLDVMNKERLHSVELLSKALQ